MNETIYPSLAGRAVYITGGGSGIGAEFVRAFCRQGAHVSFNDINDFAGTALAKDMAGGAKPPRFRKLDATDPATLQADIAAAADEFGQLDVLVNNVANDMRHAALEVTPAAWRASMAVNLDAAFFAAQAAMPHLAEQPRSSIINLSSINAILGPANMTAYVAAKAGLLGLTKALAREFGAKGVRVNAILPGWIATERQLETWLTPEAEEEWSRLVCLPGRMAASDVASLALFLAADDSAMITGQHFVVDAGRT
jgi:NAD(P)-dependent dehydrogenase (short-subunit alcohol dehydrogenase family)